MKRVNISDMKARLSRYLKMVKRGEVIEILDRDVPVARLIGLPIEQGKKGADDLLESMIRRGIAKIGPMKGVSSVWKSAPPGSRSGVLDALLEERRTGR